MIDIEQLQRLRHGMILNVKTDDEEFACIFNTVLPKENREDDRNYYDDAKNYLMTVKSINSDRYIRVDVGKLDSIDILPDAIH